MNCYWGYNVVDDLYLHKRHMNKRLLHSVAPIIRSAIGIGQYWPLSGVSAICLDFAYRYLVFKHELWVDASDFSSVMNVPKISHYTPKCELKHNRIG